MFAGPPDTLRAPRATRVPEAGDEDGQSGEGNTRLRRYEELTRPLAPRRDAQKRLASPSTATPSCFPRPALPERKPAGRRDDPESAVFTSSERTPQFHGTVGPLCRAEGNLRISKPI